MGGLFNTSRPSVDNSRYEEQLARQEQATREQEELARLKKEEQDKVYKNAIESKRATMLMSEEEEKAPTKKNTLLAV